MPNIIRIGKRDWLMGMSWTSFEAKPTKADLKSDAARLSASWASVRISESAIQGGFCSPVPGVKQPKKLYSLAAFLADSREQPWLGIFKVGEGLWWYIAVRDGHAILPDGDIVGDEQTIYQARERHSGYTDWKYFEGGMDVLTEFMSEIDAKPNAVLPLEGSNKKSIIILSSACLLSAAAGGTYLYMDAKLQQEKEIALKRERLRMELAGQIAPIVQSPLVKSPTANQWLDTCKSSLYPLPMSQNGWALDVVSCGEKSASVAWARQAGATIEVRPEGQLTVDRNRVDQIIPFDFSGVENADDAIPLDAAKEALEIWSQKASIATAFVEKEKPVALPGAAVEEPAPAAIVAQVAVTLSTPVTPFKLDFSELPGLRLTSFSLTATGWELKGILYGK